MIEELRYHDALPVEADESGDEGPIIRGFAVRYGQRSNPIKLGQGREFVEEFRQGAFAEALRSGPDMVSLVNHNADLVLGRSTAGTLRVEDIDEGLRYEVQLPDTSYAHDLLASVKRGDINGASFRFRAIKDEFRRVDGMIVRTITKATIREMGPVTYPAYASSSVEARSLPDEVAERAGSIDLTPKRTHAERRLRMLTVK